MSFETREQIEARRIMESKMQKGNGGSIQVPRSIKEKFLKAMKMDAGDFFQTKVIWDFNPKNKKITVTISKDEDA